MKLLFFQILVIIITSSSCLAAELPPLNLDEVFMGTSPNIQLTPQEKEALILAKKWQTDETGLKPVQGSDGSIRFLFGAKQPSIVCAVMQITDVELEPGEMVSSIHLGDTARWLVEPATTGAGVAEVQHLVIKPMDIGLETSLMVTTNRRTYHLRLKSHKTQYMPKVAFIYPEALMARFTAQKQQQQEAREKQTVPATGEYLGDLDFNYTISGNGTKPLRVYNDGLKTIIQMPGQMAEAPSLIVIRDGEDVMVNYRFQGDRYIVDELFDKAMLIAGVGSKQRKVVITRGR